MSDNKLKVQIHCEVLKDDLKLKINSLTQITRQINTFGTNQTIEDENRISTVRVGNLKSSSSATIIAIS